MTDDLTRAHISRLHNGEHETLLRDAKYIADGWAQYVADLERLSAATTAAEPVRLAEYTARLIRLAARLDSGREMARIFLEDEAR
ncbi:hypothetical protein [Streptomyces roseolus]|uniref:hypothetical protein n=1 Tax=Streptomyces roseolus TaxID=67358 RepID=UPI0037A5F07A